MKEYMRPLSRYEVDKLMCKSSRERARLIKRFVEKAMNLEVGGEFYQCHVGCLPTVEELRELLNETDSNKKFHVWEAINGIWVKREA